MDKFQMALYGVRLDDGGRCDRCKKPRAVVWVQELEEYRCSSCLAGTTDRRGRPRGPRALSSRPEDIAWVKEHFPEHYEEVYGRSAQDGEAPQETPEDILKRAGKMGPPTLQGPVDEESPPPAPTRPN